MALPKPDATLTLHPGAEPGTKHQYVSRIPAKGSPLAVCLQLTHAISRAVRLEHVYEAALDAIETGLGVERAAVLVFEADGASRVKAMRGLSDEESTTLDGQVPWAPGTTGARPIPVPDVTRRPALLPNAAVMTRGNITAITFVPLEGAEGVIGALGLCYAAPHEHPPD